MGFSVHCVAVVVALRPRHSGCNMGRSGHGCSALSCPLLTLCPDRRGIVPITTSSGILMSRGVPDGATLNCRMTSTNERFHTLKNCNIQLDGVVTWWNVFVLPTDYSDNS